MDITCSYCEDSTRVFQIGTGTIVPMSVIRTAHIKSGNTGEDPIVGASEFFEETIIRKRCPYCIKSRKKKVTS